MNRSDPLVSLSAFKAAVGESWQKALAYTINSPKFEYLYNYVKKEYVEQICYPPPVLIFQAYIQAPLQNIKVVILGQDPYVQPNQANGLSFSIESGMRIPPSLQYIYEALTNDPDINFQQTIAHKRQGDLNQWAEQGVFLLD